MKDTSLAEGYAPLLLSADSDAPLLKVKAPAKDARSTRAKYQLVTAMVFCFLFMIGEVVGGYFAGSLAIMTDAAHLLSDVASFLISLFAVWLAERPATTVATFGYHRVEIFGALASVVLIWFLTGILCFEAVRRVLNPEPVDGKIMFITATAGLCVNLAMMKILHQGHGHGGHGHTHGGGHSHGHGGDVEHNINVRAAFIHVVGDMVQSIGVMIAAAVIWAYPAAHIADPICTFIFSILVLFTTVGILRTAFNSLLNSVPAGVSLVRIVSDLYAIPGVSNVHDLHVWSYGQGRVALTAHIVADSPEAALAGAQRVAVSHGIKHSTVQVERCGTEDVHTCAESNALSHDCAIDLAPAAVARPPHSHSHSHGGGASARAALPEALRAQATSVLDRPAYGQRHTAADGVLHDVSPRVVSIRSAAVEKMEEHGHSHAEEGHGHSHAGEGHGHSHAAEGHGHSHAGEGHGHSHAAEGHGHSH